MRYGQLSGRSGSAIAGIGASSDRRSTTSLGLRLGLRVKVEASSFWLGNGRRLGLRIWGFPGGVWSQLNNLGGESSAVVEGRATNIGFA